MAVAVTLSLVGPVEPRAVQVAVTGLSGGEVVSVTGSAAGHSWSVRGGRSVTVSGSVLRLVDVATPINAPVTYTVTVDGVEQVEGPITVPYAPQGHHRSADAVLQSLDGRRVAHALLARGEFPRQARVRAAVADIPGRTAPVGRWDVHAGDERSWVLVTGGADTDALQGLLAAGAPLLMRTSGGVADEPAVCFALVTGVSSAWVEGWRRWEVAYIPIDDPEPDTIVPISTWDDFDAAFADLTWDDFDAEMAGMTWDDFDALDWTQYA